MQGDSINQRVIVRKGTKVKDNGLIIRQYCEERFGFRRAAFLSIGTTFYDDKIQACDTEENL